MANVGGAIHRDSAPLTDRRATAVGRKVTGHRCVGDQAELILWMYTITTPSQQTEKTIRWQAIQASGRRRQQGQWQVLKKGGTPGKAKKGNPPKKTHSLKLVISEEETVSKTDPPEEKYSLAGPTHPPKEKYSLQPIQVSYVQTLSLVMP